MASCHKMHAAQRRGGGERNGCCPPACWCCRLGPPPLLPLPAAAPSRPSCHRLLLLCPVPPAPIAGGCASAWLPALLPLPPPARPALPACLPAALVALAVPRPHRLLLLVPCLAPQIERRDYEGMLRSSQAQSRPRSSGAMAGADA